MTCAKIVTEPDRCFMCETIPYFCKNYNIISSETVRDPTGNVSNAQTQIIAKYRRNWPNLVHSRSPVLNMFMVQHNKEINELLNENIAQLKYTREIIRKPASPKNILFLSYMFHTLPQRTKNPCLHI